MEKATDFFENKKGVLFGLIAVLASSIIGYRFYKDYVKEQEMERQLQGHSQEIKRSLIPKEELLVIMSSIRKECGEELRKLREHSRQERRRVFDDEDAYQKVLDEYKKESLRIIETAHKKVFKQFKITNRNFDESVQALSSDPEVSQGANFMTKPEEEFGNVEITCLAPERVTKEVLLEILTYNNKRYNEIAYVVPRRSYEYLLTRIQDEIYFQYNLQIEELNACYTKFNCDEDPFFKSKVEEMRLSTSKLFST